MKGCVIGCCSTFVNVLPYEGLVTCPWCDLPRVHRPLEKVASSPVTQFGRSGYRKWMDGWISKPKHNRRKSVHGPLNAMKSSWKVPELCLIVVMVSFANISTSSSFKTSRLNRCQRA
ncbi:hypothetical protein XENORESO_019590 [Xenotaenia resolanae]|uniref:Uncharacterized protein n=1 Tax=Xenotaenia resolanae TaxID=208358 RepID=A0ABV0W6N1_9TELE